ncbi:MAG: threonine/serine exporter family protein [Marinilabiliaceae bacterium]|nr:threonine/serine exporter family protein [Marinilabiliaceae bacterium]
MDLLLFFEKGIWFGLAAIGFAILFNVPVRTLKLIFIIGAIGGLTKTLCLFIGINVILSSFAGSVFIGTISIFAAHTLHAPPMVFAIPSVIPMVPGVFAYRMMLGLMQLSGKVPENMFNQVLSNTISNGLNATFILLSLALGVAVPFLITRKETIKRINQNNKKNV